MGVKEDVVGRFTLSRKGVHEENGGSWAYGPAIKVCFY